MKKTVFILVIFLAVFVVKSQTLTVPTSLVLEDTTDFIHGNMRHEFANWMLSGGLIATGTENGSTIFKITDQWEPENSQINEMYAAGANTSNWPLYLVINDSVFFDDTVHTEIMGANSYTIDGRYTEVKRTWADYFNSNHVMYYQPGNGQYYVLAAKVDGSLLTLRDVIMIRNGYANCTGYNTVPNMNTKIGLGAVIHRDDW
jgi:hypothetical protein